jgi:hypothetical protein
MPEPPIKWSVEERIRAENLLSEGYSYEATAKILNKEFQNSRTKSGIRSQVRSGRVNPVKKDENPIISISNVNSRVGESDEFEKEGMDEILPVDDLIEERIKKFGRKKISYEYRKLINIKIKIDGPIGIAHFGDPHVDDDGTDLAKLYHDASTVNETAGMFAGNVGDMQNNWVGRLTHLWSAQSTSAKEAWVLTEHFINSVPWLYLIAGNHDCWSGNGDPLDWIMRGHEGVYDQHGARINLIFPNGKQVRINSRHDFKGHSMWNTAHGVSKAIQMGWKDHILTCGHTHVSGYQVLKDPMSGLISHAIRCGSYKTYDRYADEKGLDDKNVFNCPVTIIDPYYEDDDNRLITTIFNPQEGAEYLKWKRHQHESSKRAT